MKRTCKPHYRPQYLRRSLHGVGSELLAWYGGLLAIGGTNGLLLVGATGCSTTARRLKTSAFQRSL